MSKMFRLTKEEHEKLKEKTFRINKMLMEKGIPPIKDSEFLHKILLESISCAKVNKSGQIIIDP